MSISGSLKQISNYSHFRNWSPDWEVVKEVYDTFPESYSVLTPFAYSYLEELIRSTTSEYGRDLPYKNGKSKKRSTGRVLIELAIAENKPKSENFIKLLEEVKSHYQSSQPTDEGDNRHSVAHGYMHPKFWTKESFENLIHNIARLSKYSGF